MRADDSAFAEGRGCYTTARVEAGRVRFAERHARRVREQARALRIGDVSEAAVLAALTDVAKAAFPDGEGAIRVQASRDGAGAVHLVAVPRALGATRPAWSAHTAPFTYAGAVPLGGAKVASRLLHALALDAARDAGCDEALLFDEAGRLVEGARTNLFAVRDPGALVTPPAARGPVLGIARQVVLERVPEADEDDVRREELPSLRELVAVNALRGARPVVRVDGRPVGDGAPGPWAERLARALARD